MPGNHMLRKPFTAAVMVAVSFATSAARSESRFLEVYPAHAARLANATRNVRASGTYGKTKYSGNVQFSKLGTPQEYAMKNFTATETTLPWHRRVESYAPDWVFRLDGDDSAGPMEWKGVDSFAAVSDDRAMRNRQRQWEMCNMIVCGSYSVYGKTVMDIITSDDFEITREGPGDKPNTYEVKFMFVPPTQQFMPSERCIAARMVFDETFDWSLTEFDVFTQVTQHEICQYYQGRITPRRWDGGAILPETITVRAGHPEEDMKTLLGNPKWYGQEIRTAVTLSSVEFGVVKESDFMPSAFGFPDALVKSEDAPQSRGPHVIWIIVGIANIVLAGWWFVRRRAAMD
jgi:hypothetical protein